MAGVNIQIISQPDWDAKARKMTSRLSNIATFRGDQMVDEVKRNITANDNIDTATLIDNLRGTKKVSGEQIEIQVESDVSSHPEGHSGYAPILEYGSSRTRAYKNFEPALETVTKMVMEDLSEMKL